MQRLELERRGDTALLAAVEDGSYELTYLAFWPHLDAVRDDPRYPGLLERVYGPKAQAIRRVADSIRLKNQ